MVEYNFDTSKAFISKVSVEPYNEGILNGFTFAVKDLIDIKGTVSGCGNPTWQKSHTPAPFHAVCVEQLLSQGARCVGKTVTDELAFSLIGQNYFYGTPVNPKAPDRVPGGSSSGSASAVACGIVDFALGTDTGGSVRVPASNCGIWGIRPTHGRISVAGVNPFAPTFDVVGILAADSDVFKRTAKVLLPSTDKRPAFNKRVYILEDVFEICDDEIQKAYDYIQIEKVRLSDILGHKIRYTDLWELYVTLQCTEIWSSLGTWIDHHNPEFGPVSHNSFYEIAKTVDRKAIHQCIEKREEFANKINLFIEKDGSLCFPTTPSLAPLINTEGTNVTARTKGNYYPRILAMGAISGFSRAPQITIPLKEVGGVPIGLSLVGARDCDLDLIDLAINMHSC